MIPALLILLHLAALPLMLWAARRDQREGTCPHV